MMRGRNTTITVGGEQLTLLDVAGVDLSAPPASGRARRDTALEQLTAAANQRFLDRALEAIRRLAARGDPFIVDDVWTEMAATGGPSPSPTDNRAMGAALVVARRNRWIAATATFRASAQPQCHANPRRVWRPL